MNNPPLEGMIYQNLLPNTWVMMRKIHLLIAMAASLFVAACSLPPKVSMSTTRLINPEVHSEPLKVNLSAGSSTRSVITLAEAETHKDNFYVYVKAGVTVADGLEIALQDEGSGAVSVAGKYQFAGDRADKAEQGNFSQALSLGYERNSNQHNNVADQGDYWKHKTGIYDVGWILGYRVSPTTIVYGGPFYQWGDLSGEQGLGGDNGVIPLAYDGRMLGASIAVEYRLKVGIGFAGEFVLADTQWENYSNTSTHYNFKVDYQF
ncbi:MAG: hypothetical protein HRU20_19340 [Pseudomonadales bacterium]|nr:hypothetical protein [Pseudomonadales bacterium]